MSLYRRMDDENVDLSITEFYSAVKKNEIGKFFRKMDGSRKYIEVAQSQKDKDSMFSLIFSVCMCVNKGLGEWYKL